MVIFPGFWDSNVSTRYPTRKKNPKFNMKQTTGRQNMLKMPIVFRCQSHSKIKCYHIPAIERNCLYCSGAHFCRWPGWTSEQNSAVKYLNYFMWLIRTQFEPSKYLYYNDFIQLISLSGTCRCLAIPVQVLHQWVQKTCNGISTCSHWCVVFCFFFFLLWNSFRRNTCFQEHQRIYGGSQWTKWTFSITDSTIFFSNLDDCSRSHVYKISIGVWNTALNRYNYGRVHVYNDFQSLFSSLFFCCGLLLKWHLVTTLMSIAVFFSFWQTSFTNQFIKSSFPHTSSFHLISTVT